MIRSIVCDLDGTLIRNDDTIEDETLSLLKDCIYQGIELIIATGRDINMVIDILDHYQIDCHLILNNGAQYCDRAKTFNRLTPLDNNAFLNIAKILHDKGYLLAIHTDQGKYSFYDENDFWDYHIGLLTAPGSSYKGELPVKTFTTREGYLRDFHFVNSSQEIIERNIKVLKIDARHHDIYSVEGVTKQLDTNVLDISSSYEDNIEITSSQINKGIMLEQVIKEKGYHKDEVAVFGDGENDVHMLSLFEYAFVPSNACQNAKNVSQYHLTKTNENGAVGEGLKQLKEMNLIR